MNNPCPLFIDEVQKENTILEEIKSIVDESEERGRFILSGSQKLELMKGMSESLAGRVAITEVIRSCMMWTGTGRNIIRLMFLLI